MSVKLIAIIAACVVVGALVAAMTRTPDREIRLVAKGMAFYLESDPSTPNPTITVDAGERVRIVLRNDDRGFVHDFAVPAIDEGLDQVGWNKTNSTTFDMPDASGTYRYICRPHELMMSGTLIVR